jgi:hypothetical protein
MNVQEIGEQVKNTLEFIEADYCGPDAFCGSSFRQYRSLIAGAVKDPSARAGVTTDTLQYFYGDDDSEDLYLYFVPPSGDKVLLSAKPPTTGRGGAPAGPRPVSYSLFPGIQSHVESSLVTVAESLLSDIRSRFPENEKLSAFSIVYPQFWQGDWSEADVEAKVGILVAQYGQSRRMADGTVVEPIINGDELLNEVPQILHLLPTAAKNSSSITAMWRLLKTSPSVESRIPQSFRVAEIAVALVGTSVNDERTFSAMNRVTGEDRNSLKTHLELCVRFVEQRQFTLSSFPYEKAMQLEQRRHN